MFEHKYIVPKKELGTTYSSIGIKNIVFEPGEIENNLPNIIFKDENLEHIFAETDLTPKKKRSIYRRFIPKTNNKKELDMFIDDSIRSNKSFYSFLAEGILGLVFRDLYDCELAKGVIDLNDTLNDSHTGVDACMYNIKNSVIVLGEAKFYESLDAGLNKIIKDFVNKNIKNKLESLQIASENCFESNKIIIKNLSIDEYEQLTLEQFINQKIIFAGFVLHNECDVSDYDKKTFYDKYVVSVENLIKNIKDSLDTDCCNGKYEIVMVHLPISSKKNLIAKVIETSQNKLDGMIK